MSPSACTLIPLQQLRQSSLPIDHANTKRNHNSSDMRDRSKLGQDNGKFLQPTGECASVHSPRYNPYTSQHTWHTSRDTIPPPTRTKCGTWISIMSEWKPIPTTRFLVEGCQHIFLKDTLLLPHRSGDQTGDVLAANSQATIHPSFDLSIHQKCNTINAVIWKTFLPWIRLNCHFPDSVLYGPICYSCMASWRFGHSNFLLNWNTELNNSDGTTQLQMIFLWLWTLPNYIWKSALRYWKQPAPNNICDKQFHPLVMRTP